MGADLITLHEPRADEADHWAKTGREAYTDHYTHLWPGGDPKPYTSRNFTVEKVAADIRSEGLVHWLLRYKSQPAGICKLDLLRQHPEYFPGNALFLEKLYLKKEFTGMGLGTRILALLCAYARQHRIRALWLEAMQKGPALHFYMSNGFGILGETFIPYPEVLPDAGAMWVLGREV